jgi:hypothetical protein
MASLIQAMIFIAFIGIVVLIGYMVSSRSGIRRRDYYEMREERIEARKHARVMKKYLIRTQSQISLILDRMESEDRLATTTDDRLLLKALRDQLSMVEDEVNKQEDEGSEL